MNRVVFSHFWIMSFYQAFFTIVWRWNTEKFCERKWLIAIETGKEIKLMNFDVSPWIDNICDVWVLEFIFYFFFSLWYAHNFYDISNIQMCSLRRHTAFQYQSPSIQIDLNGNFLSFFFSSNKFESTHSCSSLQTVCVGIQTTVKMKWNEMKSILLYFIVLQWCDFIIVTFWESEFSLIQFRELCSKADVLIWH